MSAHGVLRLFDHWWLALWSAIIWWGMLIALMVCWAAQGHPVYSWMSDDRQTILYISDVAATNLQPIFISCAGAQGLLFVLALASERYLRHARRLRPNWRRSEKVFAGLAIACAIIGQLGILFVSIFNTKVFPDAHTSMLVVFIVFVGISSVCSIVEYFLLDRNYSDYLALRVSAIFKLIWFIIELGLAIAFATSKIKYENASAVIEWTLSFIYPFYTLSIVYDLWPARKTRRGEHANFDREAQAKVEEPDSVEF